VITVASPFALYLYTPPMLQYGVVKEEYVIKVPKERAPDGLKLNDQVGAVSGICAKLECREASNVAFKVMGRGDGAERNPHHGTEAAL
jgi:hypothetical protein